MWRYWEKLVSNRVQSLEGGGKRIYLFKNGKEQICGDCFIPGRCEKTGISRKCARRALINWMRK